MIRRIRERCRKAWRVARWPAVLLAIALLALLVPVGYVELRCRGTPASQAHQPLITDPAFQRREANTYLTYPEWHIVYAYDGLAEALKRGDEYQFDYSDSVRGFWSSTCALMRVADAHGGADWDTRSMIHTIGVSFTAEMAIKAAYEETAGRIAAWWRGPAKSPQDRVIADMSVDYAQFLRQTPWYRYPFRREARKLWTTPTDWTLRGWERRFAIGTEFSAKAVYAKLIERAAAAAPAALTIRSVVSGITREQLSQIADVTVIDEKRDALEIETPRYDLFTRILASIAQRGGTIEDIAGNGHIMVTVTVPHGSPDIPAHTTQIYRLTRDGFDSDRLILDVSVRDLADLLRRVPLGDPGVEHVFDY